MTKKEFKEQCSFHEYGRGKTKRNAIYFNWKSDPDNNAVGYKFMVKAMVETCLKSELFDILYKWVNDIETVPWYAEYKFASTEQQRFKISLMG